MIGATLTDGRVVRILFYHNDYKKKAREVAREQGLDPATVANGFSADHRTNRPGAWKVYSHSTLCSIVEGPKDQEIDLGSGESWCAVGDNFCRAVGREYALKRAILNGGFGRQDSGILLASYFNRNKGPRKPGSNHTAFIETGLRTAIKELNPAYVLEEVREIASGKGFAVFLVDPVTLTKVPMVWSKQDENQDEGHLIRFIAAFAKSGVESLGDVIKQKARKEPINNQPTEG